MCYDEGTLQAYLDRELPGRKRWEIEVHASTCESCKARLSALEEAGESALSGLSTLSRDLYSKEVAVEEVWMRLTRDERFGMPVRGKGVLDMTSKRLKTVLVPVAVAATLAISLSFAPVREAAADLLNIFRVQKVEVVNISPADMAELQRLSSPRGGKVDIENFGKIETDGYKAPEMTKSLDVAQKAVDFEVKLPAALEGGAKPEFMISNSSTISFTLDVEKTNEMIKSLDGKTLLPAELDGKKLTVQTPVLIVANYSRDDTGLSIMQARSPEVVFPEGADPNVVRDALLDIPLIPENIKSQLKSIEDWKHTLPVPNIEGKTEAQEVTVNGAEGAFITFKYPHAPAEHVPATEGTLIWQDNGVIRGISSQGMDLAKAQEIAASMK